MTPPSYPTRPPFFAYRFVRLMAKVCLANEIGAEGCWLLAVIAQTEDAGGYRKPVTFWNGQLVPLVGSGSESALRRLREKCVRSGWLMYVPGRKSVAPRYWVTVPEAFSGVDDAPSDERPGKYVATMPAAGEQESDEEPASNRRESEQESGEKADRKAARKRRESEQHSSLTLPLTQEANASCPEPAKPPASGPPVMTFPCVGTRSQSREWPLTAEKLAEYRESFPGFDVPAELRKARQWLLDNPAKRKTFAGTPRFLGSWLGRTQDRGTQPGGDRASTGPGINDGRRGRASAPAGKYAALDAGSWTPAAAGPTGPDGGGAAGHPADAGGG